MDIGLKGAREVVLLRPKKGSKVCFTRTVGKIVKTVIRAMNFCVCIKQVPDVQASMQTGRMVLNAYDASAVEEALVLSEGTDSVVDLVLIGPDTATETIRKALAMGASNAFHLKVDTLDGLDSHSIALLLNDFFSEHDYDVILTGKQSQDSDSGLAGGMLAELLGVPYASNAVGLQQEGAALCVTRQGDAGQEILELHPPCLVTCSNDMNNPRIPSLKGIMAAKRKSIAVKEVDASAPKTVTSDTFPPSPREAGVKWEGEAEELVGQLISKLQNEAGVL